MIKIQMRVYTDDRKSYYDHIFTWDEEKLIDFFSFALTFIDATYPEYIYYEIEVGYEEEA